MLKFYLYFFVNICYKFDATLKSPMDLIFILIGETIIQVKFNYRHEILVCWLPTWVKMAVEDEFHPNPRHPVQSIPFIFTKTTL